MNCVSVSVYVAVLPDIAMVMNKNTPSKINDFEICLGNNISLLLALNSYFHSMATEQSRQTV